MKIIILIILSTFFYLNHTQFDNCSVGIDRAKKNINNGINIYYEFGIPDYSRTFERLLKQKLGVKLETGGCIWSEDKICYNKFMEDTLNSRFGTGILDSIRKEAWFIDSIGQGTRSASYEGMYHEEFYKAISCKINDALLVDTPIRYAPCVIVRILINKKGIPVKYKYIRKSDKIRDIETLRIAKEFRRFNYATKNGIPIQDSIDISIRFYKERKKNLHCP